MGIFDRRVAFKPFEYPKALDYKKAISQTFWLHTEFNFLGDVHDFHVALNDGERNALKNAILAISQIEISVKKFWTKLGERFPKSEFEFVGVTFGESECFDDKTQVLTPSGWKLFEELLPEDLVAQLDDKKISFVKPIDHIKRHYNGIMHHYKGQVTDLMVTPNHEILVMHPLKYEYEKKKSIDVDWNNRYRYLTAGIASLEDPLQFTNLDKFIIAIQSEYCHIEDDNFTFTSLSKNKLNNLHDICNNLGIHLIINYHENEHSHVSGKLPKEIRELDSIKNFKYLDFSKVDSEFAKSFLHETDKWNISKEIDCIQSLAVLCNRSSFIEDGQLKVNSASNSAFYPQKEDVPYDGYVYCVTVPSGYIVTRRNTSVVISGNCRHAEAYSHLLEVLGLNEDFDQLIQNPIIQGRIDYLTKYLKGAFECSNENYAMTLALFSMFIENVSLFSQFLVIKSFNKHKNLFKDIDNVVQYTLKEEVVHSLFGVYLINQIKEEYPQWFDEQFYESLNKACLKSYEAESNIIDWIFEKGNLDFLTKDEAKEFIKDRFNESLELIGGQKLFDINEDKLENLKWFDTEIYAEVSPDFFYKKPVTYSKKVQSFTSEDLF